MALYGSFDWRLNFFRYSKFKCMYKVRGAGQFLSSYLGLLISEAAVMLCACILIGPANTAISPLSLSFSVCI